MVKIVGYILLLISVISFLLIPVIPWFGLPGKKIAAITTGLLITGEVLFYLSLFILGKAFYARLKSKLKFWKKKPGSSSSPENTKPLG